MALLPQDTKAEDARTELLTARVLRALKTLPRGTSGAAVFPDPNTGAPWRDIRKAFRRAVAASKLEGLWFHDLRRSFVTRARKLGISESVVMRMSGHRTRAVFDRYNIVDVERDSREAVRVLEKVGCVFDTVAVSRLHKRQSPTA
ncbi:MAG: tyrosine-type recombinase/integrase [Myxococcaceae bacterium]